MPRPKGALNKPKVADLVIPAGLVARCQKWLTEWKSVKSYEDIQVFLENLMNATAIGEIDKSIANSLVYQAQLQLIAIDRIRAHSNPGADLSDDARRFAESMTVEQAHRLMKATTAQMQVNIINKMAAEEKRIKDEQAGIVEAEVIKFDKNDAFTKKVSALIHITKNKNEQPLQPENVDAIVEDDDLVEF